MAKKRFQRNNWMGRIRSTKHQREQRTFAVTIAVALVLLLVAFGMARSNASFHLPFGRSTSAP